MSASPICPQFQATNEISSGPNRVPISFVGAQKSPLLLDKTYTITGGGGVWYSHFIIARHELDDDGKQYEDHARQTNETGARQTRYVLVEAERHHNTDGDEKYDAQSNGAHGVTPRREEAHQHFR